jgi:2-oxoglutarate dehydrogenase E1 component
MGGWTFVEDRIRSIKPLNTEFRYVGRDASASPATGSYAIHELEQKQIVSDALGLIQERSAAEARPAEART